MANTTNFNWETPDDTDLVKDGAAAMRTLGNSIDTSFVDLKGGTTGQVLSKASNTDLDYTWVTTDDANAIQNAIVDAKGDLIAASANDTPARLAVGANGETLVADSSTATGLKWAAPSTGSSNVAGKNGVLNSNLTIWQRSTSNTGGGYTADRFAAYQASSLFVTSRQTASLTGFQFCLRNQRPSGNTSTGISYIYQDFESINSTIYAGQTVTFSFYAKAGANFSASGSGLVARVISGTGTDQNSVLAGYTGQTNVINQTATLTTSWQRFSYTGTVGSSINQIGFNFLWTPTGTAGAADFVDVTGVQLEIASSASAYSPNGATFQGELAACQRYYYRDTPGTAYGSFAIGQVISSVDARFIVNLPVQMRTQAASLEYSNVGATSTTHGAIGTPTTFTIGQSGVNTVTLNFNVSGIFTSAGQSTLLIANNSTSAYLGFSAEL